MFGGQSCPRPLILSIDWIVRVMVHVSKQLKQDVSNQDIFPFMNVKSNTFGFKIVYFKKLFNIFKSELSL